MATLADLHDALINADKAGDTEAARQLADAIVAMGGQKQRRDPGVMGDSSPTSTMSGMDKFLAGAGKAMVDTARGAGQLGGRVSRGDVAESRQLDAPLMKTGAGITGNIAGNVAMLAPTAMIPGANTLTGAGAIGAITGLLQPSVSGQETATNVALGGAGGAAGQKIANMIGGRAAQAGSALTQEQAAAGRAGQNIGLKLTPGKASGSAALQRMEASMESNPATSSAFDTLKANNQRATARAAAKSIGENADELGTAVLSRAEQRIGAVFNSVADKTPVPLNPMTIGARLRQIATDSDGMLANNADIASNGLWKRLDSFVNDKGGATREQLRKLSSDLGKKARQEMTTPMGDRALGDAMFQAQEVVEDAIVGTLTAPQRVAYDEARKQYRNMMLLTAKTNITNPSSGNVSARNLASELMRKDRGGFTMGGNQSDMYAAARFAQAFPNIVGDSGTATRSAGMTDWLMAMPTNALASAYLSQPMVNAVRLGGGAANVTANALDNPLLRALWAPAGMAGALQVQK
jgi:hypothetical protein